ncbi:hypothetical protein [Bifidobacterium tissieri]|uniref:hypothetical protein n=1 Tax=Bifidobacterium tissieri TaxID=1630162 RepID=UPI00168ADF62|nr:hypothetical protein [Bifidobacterium tissieri]TPF96477.1 hypothetical protein EP30_07510 [Bifidobacterium sp. UTCIF-39]
MENNALKNMALGMVSAEISPNAYRISKNHGVIRGNRGSNATVKADVRQSATAGLADTMP